MAPGTDLDDDPTLAKLRSACSDLKTLLRASSKMEQSLFDMDRGFDATEETLSAASKRVAPLQSLAMAARALETRINRAVSPALSLLDAFRLSESLQRELLDLADRLAAEQSPRKRLKKLLRYVDCVDRLNEAVNTIGVDGEPVIQRLQEVVEFLSRTKATDQFRTLRLRETLLTLKALYETEVDAMRFDGLLDEALLNLQDEYESILLQLTHQNIGNGDGDGEEPKTAPFDLGSELEVEALRRISETLTANDCLDISIDIFVKVRYRRAAKALMRLNPDYLKTHTQEEIDEMEWGSLETAITLWIQHFELSVRTVFVLEKKLCFEVMGNVMEGLIWAECFVKIADKIMAVFFRFGEGVARSSKEPQKLFKLLDMFDSLERLKTEFYEIFEGEAGADICTRFRELEKLLVHASSKVFWEFGLQIEGNSDGLPPPADGSVPKLVRYAVNYLKYLATENYRAPMASVLRTEQIWKAGILSKPESDESLLGDAITNVMEALERNVEAKRSRYRDRVLPNVFSMNTYWYIYMRTRNTELGRLLGDQAMKKKYKVVAEESAYMYQKQAWVPLVRLLERDDFKKLQSGSAAVGAVARGKVEAFLKGLEEMAARHRGGYSIPDADLREQIREATVKLVVPVYAEFVSSFSAQLTQQGKGYPSAESVKELVKEILDGGGDREVKLKCRDSRDRKSGGSSAAVDGVVRGFGFGRSKSNVSDM